MPYFLPAADNYFGICVPLNCRSGMMTLLRAYSSAAGLLIAVRASPRSARSSQSDKKKTQIWWLRCSMFHICYKIMLELTVAEWRKQEFAQVQKNHH